MIEYTRIRVIGVLNNNFIDAINQLRAHMEDLFLDYREEDSSTPPYYGMIDPISGYNAGKRCRIVTFHVTDNKKINAIVALKLKLANTKEIDYTFWDIR